MMTATQLLSTLRAHGVLLRAQGDHLDIDAPEGVLTDALRQSMRQHKEALLTLLELFEERAGILEYGAGLPRTDAERQAWAIVLVEPDPKTGPHTTGHAVVGCPACGSRHVNTAGGGSLGLATCGACFHQFTRLANLKNGRTP